MMPPLILSVPMPLITKPSPQVKTYAPVATLIDKVLPLPAKSTIVRLNCDKVTVKPQLTVPLHPLSAVQLTGVDPRGKVAPEGGVHVATTPLLVTGVTKLTAVEPPVADETQKLGGQESVAGVHRQD